MLIHNSKDSTFISKDYESPLEETKHFKKIHNPFPTALVLGIIMTLGVLFLAFVSGRVFGSALGYGGLAMGTALLMIGAVNLIEVAKCYLSSEGSNKENLKVILDRLFESRGGIDSIPNFPLFLSEYPLINEMKKPIMKGYFVHHEMKRPLIAIKMRCLNTPEEIKGISEDRSTQCPQIPLEKVFVICQNPTDGLLFGGGYEEFSWGEFSGRVFDPHFFTEGFICRDNGEFTLGQMDCFESLHQLIKNGSGEDLFGIKWGIDLVA